MHNNDCETPFIDIYIDLLLINFSLLFVLTLHCAYHQNSDYEIYTGMLKPTFSFLIHRHVERNL